MNAVTSGNLIISSDLNISKIQEFDMKIEKNCHTAARIIGSIPDETGESPVFQKLEGSSITVSEADENGNEISPPIFYGFATQEISIVRRDTASPTVINLCNGFDSIGKFGKVKMEGSNEVGFPVFDSSDSGKYDISGAENAVMASTPCAAGSTGLKRQITGIKVDIVTAG